MSPMTVDFRNQSSVSASWIHKEIRDQADNGIVDDGSGGGDLSNVIAACRQNPDLLWECNSRRWTAMHVVASSYDNVHHWKELLQLAVSTTATTSAHFGCKQSNNNNNSKLKLSELETDTGYTCVDLFFRRALYPLRWQRRRQEVTRRANLLRMSIKNVCSSKSCVQQLKDQLHRNEDTKPHKPTSTRNFNEDEDDDHHLRVVDPVAVVLQFWKNTELLLKAIYFEDEAAMDDNKYQEEIPFLHILSSLRWCPSPLAELAIKLFPNQLQCSGDGQHIEPPLHIWSRTNKSLRLYDSGMLHILCQANPKAASTPNPLRYHNLPLQTALLFGKVWSEIVPLFETYPQVVYHIDTQTLLPTFCLPVVFGNYSSQQVEDVAKRCDPQRLSVWCYISKQEKNRAIQDAQEYLDCQQITTIYELLCRNPSAIDISCTAVYR